MRKIALFLCILLISAYSGAQTSNDQREVTVRKLVLNISPDRLSPTNQQQIVGDILSRKCAGDPVNEIPALVRYALQMRGFLKAEVGQPAVVVVSESPQQQVVDIALSVNLGSQYRLKSISFLHQKAFADSELRAQFPIADGDIFNVEEIRQGLDDLRKLYATQGYVNFTPVPNTEVDDTGHTISLVVDVDEGKQFRIGGLVLDGPELTPGAGARLLANWKQYEGQLYDYRIVEKFLQENAALLPAGLTPEKNLAITQDPHRGIVLFRLDLPDPVD